MWISPKLFLDQLNAWNLSEVGFRSGPQNFIRCYPNILFWFNSLIPPMNLSEVSEQFFPISQDIKG